MSPSGSSSVESRKPRRDSIAAAVVLAAGRGQRFTAGTKQLALLGDRPLVAHAVSSARHGGAARIVVVVGHDAEAVAAAARAEEPDVEVVHNPDHGHGQATSLAAGIRTLAADVRVGAAVLLLADQPGVDAATVRAVAGAVLGGRVAARARYADGPGHPVAFAREVFDRLRAVEGDVGARHLLEELDLSEIEVPGWAPRDVDTVRDLEQVRGMLT